MSDDYERARAMIETARRDDALGRAMKASIEQRIAGGVEGAAGPDAGGGPPHRGERSPKRVRTKATASRAPGCPSASRSNARVALSTAPG